MTNHNPPEFHQQWQIKFQGGAPWKVIESLAEEQPEK